MVCELFCNCHAMWLRAMGSKHLENKERKQLFHLPGSCSTTTKESIVTALEV